MAAKKTTGNERKIVVDTNVILFDALAINKFQDADIYIPFAVIEEIDRFKRDLGENGRNARQFSRFIDVLRSQGSLSEGVALDRGNSKVFVSTDPFIDGIPKELDQMKPDNRILAKAMQLTRLFPQNKIELISKDINLRIKADVYGITATDYRPESSDIEELYTGLNEVEVPSEFIDRFYKEKSIKL
ncbi:MAG: PIN domain-containing protein, partial [Bdellovibrionota bacterium]